MARRHFFHRSMRGSLLSVLSLVSVLSVSCGEVVEINPKPVSPVEIRREPAVGNAQERFQQLRTDTLRLMIAAAQRELDIGPFQRRIDTTVALSVTDMESAANALEKVATDLESLLSQ